MTKNRMIVLELLIVSMLWFGSTAVFADGAYDKALVFDPAVSETLNVALDGKPLSVAKYTVIYVANPIPIAVGGARAAKGSHRLAENEHLCARDGRRGSGHSDYFEC